jgi:hypothetical protein
MTGLGKTAWVDRHLGLVWERVRQAVPDEEWLPLVAEERGRGFVSVEELGCGHYGCVMPSYKPEVVVKLTSDTTEAFFVAAALELGRRDEDAWEGLTEYFAIYRIKGAFHRRRPLYILWREAAFDVGGPALVKVYRDDDYKRRSLQQLFAYLDKFKWSANKVRQALRKGTDPYALVDKAKEYEDWAWGTVEEHPGNAQNALHDKARAPHWSKNARGAQGVAAHLRHCQLIAELMEYTCLSDHVGRALSFYLERGLLLADVHQGNVGHVTRPDYTEPRIVITDPGHAVPLIDEWDEIEIEEI